MDEQYACIRIAVEHAKLKLISDAFVVENTINEIKCCFVFKTDDWNGLTKTAVFVVENKPNVNPIHVVLDANNSCIVPADIISEHGEFNIGVFGADATHRLPTNLISFKVHEGCYSAGIIPSPSNT